MIWRRCKGRLPWGPHRHCQYDLTSPLHQLVGRPSTPYGHSRYWRRRHSVGLCGRASRAPTRILRKGRLAKCAVSSRSTSTSTTSEMTYRYTVSGGALNSTHSLTRISATRVYIKWIKTRIANICSMNYYRRLSICGSYLRVVIKLLCDPWCQFCSAVFQWHIAVKNVDTIICAWCD